MADMLETRHARVLTRLRADYDDFSIAQVALRHCSESSADASGGARLTGAVRFARAHRFASLLCR
jgi:hypothetical protein